jgi:hypothetical protein
MTWLVRLEVEREARQVTSIELAGKRVALTPEGIEQSEHGEVGKEIVEAVRTAVERATEG